MIVSGAFLIQEGTPLPASVEIPEDRLAHGWRAVGNEAEIRQLKVDLDKAGWSCFYMASIKKTAFGGAAAKRLAAAMKRITAKVQLEKCNSLQIDKVSAHSFLGLAYLSVSAHLCHIQKGVLFASGRE